MNAHDDMPDTARTTVCLDHCLAIYDAMLRLLPLTETERRERRARMQAILLAPREEPAVSGAEIAIALCDLGLSGGQE